VPRIWTETIAAHRDAVREATLDAAGALVAEHGLTGMTMSQIAQQSGIGRATLYKYFPDLDSVLASWHERQVSAHLRHLTEIADRTDGAAARLHAVLTAYAGLSGRQGHGSDMAAALHRGEHIAHAHAHLNEFLTDLIREAVADGDARNDIPPGELAAYCLHALGAATGLASKAARDRLVRVTLAGLQPACSGSSEKHDVAPNSNQDNAHPRPPARVTG
jgi:AcrR family transcriptional regulator